jgi:uncharacterized protein (DUF1778 family)
MIWPEHRSERIHIRVAPEVKRTIEQAAKDLGMSLSEFVLSTVLDRADEVLAHRTLVESTYFDQLLAALDEPPRVVPELLDAMQKHAMADA